MNLSKLKHYLRDYSLREAAVKVSDRLLRRVPEDVPYEKWLRRSRPSSKDYARMTRDRDKFAYQPVFAVYSKAEGDDRTRFMQSLNLQIYRHFRAWKDCDEADYMLICGPKCTLRTDLLWRCAELLNQEGGREIGLIYFDSDVIDENGNKTEPAFRPEADKDLLESVNYMGNVIVVRSDIAFSASLQDAGKPEGGDFSKALHRFLINAVSQLGVMPGHERDGAVRHIPRILYHEVRSEAENIGTRKVDKGEKKDGQLISVIIPNCEHEADLIRCVKSLQEVNAYGNLEILIIENNSRDPAIFDCYERLRKQDPRIRVLTCDGAFNYSAINNFAAANAKGKYLLLLNNDTAIIKPASLWHMKKLAARSDVGAVGALLMYPDDTVQHAGVILGYGGIAGHAFAGEDPEAGLPGYEKLLFWNTRNVSAVTGACMMLRREVFLKAGGFDETLTVTFNDIDLCLTLRKMGLKVLECPDALLIHDESKSRGAEDSDEKVGRFHDEIRHFMKKWEEELRAGDPFYNPNLTLIGRTYTCKDQLRERTAPYKKYVNL